MKIHAIVEGHSEVEAVPVLLRKLLAINNSTIRAGKAIRKSRSIIAQELGLRDAIKVALKQDDCGMILVLIDADDDCPKEIGPKLANWARLESGNIPCEVVLANREYESWFLASFESLRGKYLRDDAVFTLPCETVRGAKECLAGFLPDGAIYVERRLQPAMTELFDMKKAHENSRSFRKFIKAFGKLCGITDVKLEF